MSNIENLKRQHKDIRKEMDNIDAIINKRDYENYLDDFVMYVNNLAGKLNVHLNSEDKFLYPDLINEKDLELKNIANRYIHEMGDISKKFMEYKNKFNTKSKINEKLDEFVPQTKIIISQIKNRISREENELYKLILKK
ncbi:hemerythrin domain-containing protein [Clostridium sp. JN-1]|jgi:hemerythrin-like domain-containing protein|uniref:hemerythrin domain-containing protein n=1 Tax=Clostridium sp. JN-1 TaxID=2483110 RepID=UPI000F0B92EA|nr:hemerythrin domain-containing protein [Clostridium sp. JN-1]